MNSLLLPLTGCGLSSMALISGCLGTVVQNLQTFQDINVSYESEDKIEKKIEFQCYENNFPFPYEGKGQVLDDFLSRQNENSYNGIHLYKGESNGSFIKTTRIDILC